MDAAAHALPVADRWHLFENASVAFLDAVRKSMRVIRTAIGGTTINPDLLTCAEKLQYEGYLRREATTADIIALVRDVVAIKQICPTELARSSSALARCAMGQRMSQGRRAVAPHARAWLRGSMRVVSEWATRRRRAETAPDHQLRKMPSARTIARLLTMARDHLSKAESVTVAAIEAGVAALTESRMLVERFHTMIRSDVEGAIDNRPPRPRPAPALPRVRTR